MSSHVNSFLLYSMWIQIIQNTLNLIHVSDVSRKLARARLHSMRWRKNAKTTQRERVFFSHLDSSCLGEPHLASPLTTAQDLVLFLWKNLDEVNDSSNSSNHEVWNQAFCSSSQESEYDEGLRCFPQILPTIALLNDVCIVLCCRRNTRRLQKKRYR